MSGPLVIFFYLGPKGPFILNSKKPILTYTYLNIHIQPKTANGSFSFLFPFPLFCLCLCLCLTAFWEITRKKGLFIPMATITGYTDLAVAPKHLNPLAKTVDTQSVLKR